MLGRRGGILAGLAAICLSLASLNLAVAAADHFMFSIDELQEDAQAVFSGWAIFNSKQYSSKEEADKRFAVWSANVQRQVERQGESAEQLAVNGLADLTREEFKAAYLGHASQSNGELLRAGKKGKREPYRYEHITPPAHVDWREKDVVGPVKDQHVGGAPCGCCWAFATIGVSECIVAMATGKVLSLSEQQLIDCDRAGPWYDLGCDGGDFEGGVDYIVENGIDTESDYPYIAHDAKCQRRKEGRVAATLDGFAHVPPQNETAIAQAVSQHPVAVAVCCGDYIDNWHAYTGGIFEIPDTDIPGGCTDPLDHAVVIVGYGTTEEGQDYWLIKNSWSERWGEKGFFRVRRNVGAPLAAFGLATQPGYPVKRGVNSEADPIRTDTWTAPASAAATALA